MPGALMPENRDGRQPILGKVMICVTEDWFALSHFRPLIRRLCQIAADVVVVTRSSGRLAEIEQMGARTIHLEYNRSSMNPVREMRTTRQLAALMRRERPDAVHLIAMKPIVLGGLAVLTGPVRHTVVHMTGLGFLAISDTAKARLARKMALAIIRRVIAQPESWLLVENPEDLTFLEQGGVAPGHRVTMLGGAGIDPAAFPGANSGASSSSHAAGDAVPVAAFVGRMIRSKGVGVLMEAARLLKARNVPLVIELYGETDDGNPEAIANDTLNSWSDGQRTRYMGFTRDVAAVWRRADIFVLPALSREGMPRALLEAAASGRPIVVTDVPGCRHFVQDGVEGFIVPPSDPNALAAVLERLAHNPALRAQLGSAARAKVLAGYTETHVEAGIEAAYRAMVEGPGAKH